MFYELPEIETKKEVCIASEGPDSQGLLLCQHKPTVKAAIHQVIILNP